MARSVQMVEVNSGKIDAGHLHTARPSRGPTPRIAIQYVRVDTDRENCTTRVLRVARRVEMTEAIFEKMKFTFLRKY